MKKIKIAPLLTRAQLAKYLCCTTRAIQNWQRLGLPTVWVGKNPRYELHEVRDWFKSGAGHIKKEKPVFTKEDGIAALEKISPELAEKMRAIRAKTSSQEYEEQERQRADRLQKVSDEFVRDTYGNRKVGDG